MSKSCFLVLAVCFSTGISLAQPQTTYGGVNITGQLVLSRTVNLSAQAQLQTQSSASASVQVPLFGIHSSSPVRRGFESEVPPSLRHNFPAISSLGVISAGANSSLPAARGMAVAPPSTRSRLSGITHF